MLYQTVNFSLFCDAFRGMDRDNNFTYEGKKLLFDYLDESEDDIELDIVALCCEFAEDTPDGIADAYSIDISECSEEEKIEKVMEYLQGNTIFVGKTAQNSIVYAEF